MRHRVGDPPIHDVLQPSPPTPKIPGIPSPFVIKTPAGSRATKKEIKSMSHPLTSLSALTPLPKDYRKEASERGTIPPVSTGRRQRLWTIRLGSFTYLRLMGCC